MTKQEILDFLDDMVLTEIYKTSDQREALCEAREVVNACSDDFIKKNTNNYD